jgi:hypothetical protein
MNKLTKSDNKRVKHWQRVSSANQFPKSSANPSANRQVSKDATLAQPVKQTSDSDLPTSTEQAADLHDALRKWDNEGGMEHTAPPNPKP